jgi:hypothetical protein
VVAGADPQVLADGTAHNALGAEGGIPEGHGRDPWTQELVKITRNPGADQDAPYGRKRDGSPRRSSGPRVAQ